MYTCLYYFIDTHIFLEHRIAQFLGAEDAILYSSAFCTTSSTIPCFSKRGDIIICDRGVSHHIQTGIVLSRYIQFLIFYLFHCIFYFYLFLYILFFYVILFVLLRYLFSYVGALFITLTTMMWQIWRGSSRKPCPKIPLSLSENSLLLRDCTSTMETCAPLRKSWPWRTSTSSDSFLMNLTLLVPLVLLEEESLSWLVLIERMLSCWLETWAMDLEAVEDSVLLLSLLSTINASRVLVTCSLHLSLLSFLPVLRHPLICLRPILPCSLLSTRMLSTSSSASMLVLLAGSYIATIIYYISYIKRVIQEWSRQGRHRTDHHLSPRVSHHPPTPNTIKKQGHTRWGRRCIRISVHTCILKCRCLSFPCKIHWFWNIPPSSFYSCLHECCFH